VQASRPVCLPCVDAHSSVRCTPNYLPCQHTHCPSGVGVRRRPILCLLAKNTFLWLCLLLLESVYMHTCAFYRVGRIPWGDATRLQEETLANVRASRALRESADLQNLQLAGSVLLCEHSPVYTVDKHRRSALPELPAPPPLHACVGVVFVYAAVWFSSATTACVGVVLVCAAAWFSSFLAWLLLNTHTAGHHRAAFNGTRASYASHTCPLSTTCYPVPYTLHGPRPADAGHRWRRRAFELWASTLHG
jgi:hypothetical protein